MRRAFTLIELLVIIGIMAAMVTASIVSVRAGQGAIRVRGATRDIFASIRHARSMALLSQRPVVITYSCVEEDGESIARVEVHSTPVLDTKTDRGEIQTLSGEPLKGSDSKYELVHIRGKGEGSDLSNGSSRKKVASAKSKTKTESEEGAEEQQVGQGVEDVLFAQIADDVVRGMRIKVTMGDDTLDYDADETKNKSKISVFSNVDYLLGKFKESQKAAETKKADEEKKSSTASSGADKDKKDKDENQEPVSIVWETNGRVEPHRVWVYADGDEPEKGLSIKIDRFGGAKVLGAGEEDDK